MEEGTPSPLARQFAAEDSGKNGGTMRVRVVLYEKVTVTFKKKQFSYR